jgi:hypothetical protein
MCPPFPPPDVLIFIVAAQSGPAPLPPPPPALGNPFCRRSNWLTASSIWESSVVTILPGVLGGREAQTYHSESADCEKARRWLRCTYNIPIGTIRDTPIFKLCRARRASKHGHRHNVGQDLLGHFRGSIDNCKSTLGMTAQRILLLWTSFDLFG